MKGYKMFFPLKPGSEDDDTVDGSKIYWAQNF